MLSSPGAPNPAPRAGIYYGKKTIIDGTGACVTIGKAAAQDVLWVQNANFALKAQVQVSEGVVKSYAINSKTLIQYLKGATNVGVESFPQTITNATIVVTNDVRLPAGTNVGAAFTLTNYPVVINGVTYTNTVPLDLTLLPGDPVTYTFPNVINEIGTNVTGFDTNATGLIFATGEFVNATDITAIQGTGGTNETVFTVIGTSISSSEQQVTNIVPAQFASKSQRLIVKSLPDTETFFFFIRDGTAKSFVDYDVTTFFHYAQLAKVTQAKGSAFTDYLDLSIDLGGDLSRYGIPNRSQRQADARQGKWK